MGTRAEANSPQIKDRPADRSPVFVDGTRRRLFHVRGAAWSSSLAVVAFMGAMGIALVPSSLGGPSIWSGLDPSQTTPPTAGFPSHPQTPTPTATAGGIADTEFRIPVRPSTSPSIAASSGKSQAAKPSSSAGGASTLATSVSIAPPAPSVSVGPLAPNSTTPTPVATMKTPPGQAKKTTAPPGNSAEPPGRNK